jgi:hypothetical protein
LKFILKQSELNNKNHSVQYKQLYPSSYFYAPVSKDRGHRFWLVRLFVFKIFNIGHIFWVVSYKAFIFHLNVFCDKTFLLLPWYLTSWPWPTFKNINIGHTFWKVSVTTFIFHMCILCDEGFLLVHWFLSSWNWLSTLTYFLKTLTQGMSFEFRNEANFEVLYMIYCNLGQFTLIILSISILIFDLLNETYFFFLTLTMAISLNDKWQAFIYHMCVPCDESFLFVPKFLTFLPWSFTYFLL